MSYHVLLLGALILVLYRVLVLPFPWAAAAAGVQIGSSLLGSKRRGPSAQTVRRRGRFVLNARRGRMNQLFDKAEQQKREGLGVIRKGRTDTLKESGRILRTGQRRINERESRQLGAQDQSLTSRGLTGTSVRGAERRRVQNASDRATDELSTNFAAFRSDIYSNYANAEAGALRDLGNFYQTRYATESQDYYAPLFELLTGMQNTAAPMAPIDLSGFLPFLGGSSKKGGSSNTGGGGSGGYQTEYG